METLKQFAPNLSALSTLEQEAVCESLKLWTIFFAIHTGFASVRAKRLVGRYASFLAPVYRILYLGVSIFVLYRIGVVTAKSNSDWLFKEAPEWFFWARVGLGTAALAKFHVIVLFIYDAGEFFGFTPLLKRRKAITPQDPFHIHFVHRFIRHPMFLTCICFVLSAARTRIELLHAVIASLYWLAGPMLEDPKLAMEFGPAFEEYRRRVPAFLPIRGLALTKEEATKLSADMNEYREKNAVKKAQ
ncbi:MAG: hypothetical protein MHM6MM_003725 [Cercozoa sp. M6MM]